MSVIQLKNAATAVVGASSIVFGAVSTAQAETVLESATLVPSPNAGYTISETQQIGWRFSLDKPLQVTEIGGYFGAFNYYPNIYGAIVSLDGPSAFPEGTADSLQNVQAATTLTQNPDSLSDTLAPLSVLLNPGNYGLIFGTGQFGATGESAMPSDGVDNPGSSYFFSNSYFGDYTWQEANFSGLRFIVKGEEAKQSVPEPAPVLGLFCFGSLIVFGIKHQRFSGATFSK